MLGLSPHGKVKQSRSQVEKEGPWGGRGETRGGRCHGTKRKRRFQEERVVHKLRELLGGG